jgi:hypothetical protein
MLHHRLQLLLQSWSEVQLVAARRACGLTCTMASLTTYTQGASGAVEFSKWSQQYVTIGAHGF